jgi:S-adenosylmethionine-dependent methyltransferase
MAENPLSKEILIQIQDAVQPRNMMSQSVKDYYNAYAQREQERLDLPLCKIEFACTLWLIDKYFPKAGRICDIGGATGRYTSELLHKGYQVTLFDLSDHEVKLAEIQLQKQGLIADQLITGDARDLSVFPSNNFDAVLLLGPLYHLIEPGERAQVLKELMRILKPNAVAIIAYLNSWGLIKTGISDFPDWYKDISFLRSMLSEHTFTGQELSGFTECYWSTPEAALKEVREAGLEVISYAGAESFAGGMGELIERLAINHPEAYQNIVIVAAEMCELKQYRDSTDHIHIIAKKKRHIDNKLSLQGEK